MATTNYGDGSYSTGAYGDRVDWARTGRGQTPRRGRGSSVYIGTGIPGVFLRIGDAEVTRYCVSVDRVGTQYDLFDVTPLGAGVEQTLPGQQSGSFAVKLLVDRAMGARLAAILATPPVYVEIFHPTLGWFGGNCVPKIAGDLDVSEATKLMTVALTAAEQLVWAAGPS